jgi:hypothetical protein
MDEHQTRLKLTRNIRKAKGTRDRFNIKDELVLGNIEDKSNRRIKRIWLPSRCPTRGKMCS